MHAADAAMLRPTTRPPAWKEPIRHGQLRDPGRRHARQTYPPRRRAPRRIQPEPPERRQSGSSAGPQPLEMAAATARQQRQVSARVVIRAGCFPDGRRALFIAGGLRAVQPGQIPVEGAERQVTCLAGNFQNEAIGEAQRGARAEMVQRERDHVGILQRQFPVSAAGRSRLRSARASGCRPRRAPTASPPAPGETPMPLSRQTPPRH